MFTTETVNQFVHRNWPLVAISLLYLLIALLTFDAIEEDSYIYFRFAANIANGYGYVFNQGGEAIESGTSILWQLIMVVVYWLDADMVVTTKFLGITLGVCALILTTKVATFYVDNPAAKYLPAMLLACSYPFYMWSHLGLETPLLLCVVLVFFLVILDEGYSRYWPLFAFLVVAVRPEGFMLCALLIPMLILQQKNTAYYIRIAVFVLLVGGLVLFRLAYFQDVVPNPFYMKLNTVQSIGLATTGAYLKSTWLHIPLAVGLLGLAGTYHRLGIYRITLLLGALVIGLTWAENGIDIKLFLRSYVAITPFALILVAVGAQWLIARAGERSSLVASAYWSYALFLLLAVAPAKEENLIMRSLALLAQQESLRDYYVYLFEGPDSGLPGRAGPEMPRQMYDNFQVQTGQFIANNYPPGITVLYDQMGQTPWYAGLDKVFIDSLGLMDKTTSLFLFERRMQNSSFLRFYNRVTQPLIIMAGGESRVGHTKEELLGYIFGLNPEVIMMHTLVLRNEKSVPAMINQSKLLHESYTKKYQLLWAIVYERNDIHKLERDLACDAYPYCTRFQIGENEVVH